MRKTFVALAVAGSALAMPALAGQHIIDIAWDATGRFAHVASVPGGKFVEVCGALNVGDQVRWRFNAGVPLDFNIHYHVGKSTEFPTKQAQATAAEDVLRVAVKETYCWMWTNKAAQAVRVEVQMER